VRHQRGKGRSEGETEGRKGKEGWKGRNGPRINGRRIKIKERREREKEREGEEEMWAKSVFLS